MQQPSVPMQTPGSQARPFATPPLQTGNAPPSYSRPEHPLQRAAPPNGQPTLQRPLPPQQQRNDSLPLQQSQKPSKSFLSRGKSVLPQSKLSKPQQSEERRTLLAPHNQRTLPVPFLLESGPERDDFFHYPGPKVKRIGRARMIADGKYIRGDGSFCNSRACMNCLGLALMAGISLAIFMGYPLYVSDSRLNLKFELAL